MLPEEKTTTLTRIQFAEGSLRLIISMVETGENCEKVLLQLQALQIALHATGRLLLLHQLQRTIENICHNNCPEERSAEAERLVDLYRFFLIYS
jgi:DNA-binding FrmR family transcriptional regulator